MPTPRPRLMVSTLILLVAVAASALGLVATVARWDHEDAAIGAVLGAILVVAIVGAEGLVGIRFRGNAALRLLRVGLAYLGFTVLIRLLQWGGGSAFMMALAACLAALGFVAAINADWTRATGHGVLAGWPRAGELVATTFLVMMLGLLGTILVPILVGMVILLISLV